MGKIGEAIAGNRAVLHKADKVVDKAYFAVGGITARCACCQSGKELDLVKLCVISEQQYACKA